LHQLPQEQTKTANFFTASQTSILTKPLN